jgi:diguanylate cyclase (GGDEF)-like protein
LGTLCVIDRVPRNFSEKEIETLTDLAALVEAELQRRELGELTLQLSRELSASERRESVDALTRVWKRSYMLALLDREIQRNMEVGDSMQVGILRIDTLKSANERFGQAAGDALLREVSRRLRKHLGTAGVLGRFSGGKFILMLRNCCQELALELANRLCQGAVASPVGSDFGQLTVKVSLGLTSMASGQLKTTEKLIDEAELSLHQSSHDGSRGVCVSPGAVWETRLALTTPTEA